MNRLDRSASHLSGGLALGGATIATTAIGPYGDLSLGLCIVGGLGLAVGLAFSRQSLITAGSGTLVAAVLLAGTGGAPVIATLVGITATLLAWDFGTNALEVGAQLGQAAPTARLELVHASASTLVGLVVITVAYLVYELAAGGQPVSAVFGLLLAVLILLAAIRRVEVLPEYGS